MRLKGLSQLLPYCLAVCILLFLRPERLLAQSGFFDAEPELQLVDIYLERWLLKSAVPAYIQGEQLYLPVKELADSLGLATELDLSSAYFSTPGLTGHTGFSLRSKPDQQLIYQRGSQVQFWPSESWLADMLDFDHDLFLHKRYIEQLWPLSLHFDPRNLRLELATQAHFPSLEARLRKLKREALLARADRTDLIESKVPGLAYASFSRPLIYWSYFNNVSTGAERAYLNMRHDLAGLGHEWQLLAEKEPDKSSQDHFKIETVHWKANYMAAEDGSPRSLPGGIQYMEIGDVRQQGVFAAGPSLEGRGLNLSGFPPASHSLFDLHQLVGQAPPGWEADLYLNHQLQDYQVVNDQGQYSFDLLLKQGNNQANVYLYGPFGETRVDRYTFRLGDEFLPQGRFAAAYKIIEPDVSVFNADEDRAKRKLISPLYQHHLTMAYGLAPGLGLTGHLLYQDLVDDSAWISGMALSGSHYGWQWRWQQFHEREYYLSRMQGHYTQSAWHWYWDAAHHPDWPAFERAGNSLQSRVALGGQYMGQVSGHALRLGSDIKTEVYRQYQKDSIAFLENLNIGFWNIQLKQSCSRMRKIGQPNSGFVLDHAVICDIENRGIFQKQALRVSLDTAGQYKEKWQSARVGTEVRYHFGQYVSDPEWQDLTQPLNITLNYQTTYDFNHSNPRKDYGGYLAWRNPLRYLTAGLRLGWQKEEGVQFSFQISGSLLPGKKGYTPHSERLQHPVEITAYHDQKYQNAPSPTSPMIEGVRFRQGSRPSEPTNAQGKVWIDLNPRASLNADLNSLEDPYQISGRKRFRLASRLERVVHLDWPFIDTGSLEGVLLSAEGKPLANREINLIARGTEASVVTMYTAFDGFWVFEFLPPDIYDIYLNDHDALTHLATVTLEPDNFWRTVVTRLASEDNGALPNSMPMSTQPSN